MWLDLTTSQTYKFLSEVRQARPTVSMPEPITDEILAEQGFAVVALATPPAHDPMTQNLTELAPAEVNGVWTQQWEVTDATNEEKAQRLATRRGNMIVTPFQAKAALFNAGLLDEVETLINDAATSTLTKLAWSNAIEWRRLSPMILELAAGLNLTDAQLDALFDAAAQIEA